MISQQMVIFREILYADPFWGRKMGGGGVKLGGGSIREYMVYENITNTDDLISFFFSAKTHIASSTCTLLAKSALTNPDNCINR